MLIYCQKAAAAATAPRTLAKTLTLFPLAPLKTGVDEAEADEEAIPVLEAVGIGMDIEDQADMEGFEPEDPLHFEPSPMGPLGSPT